MSAATEGRERPPTAWVVAGLVALAFAAYARVGSFGFVSYDDPDYVTTNPWVRDGLTWPGVRWALTAAHASNWHPLTWLAHMLDVELYELRPAGHHWSSVILHAASSGLCFVALRALTRRPWPAFWVAALFALHPLRVESVAWISERKDVLSGVFFFLALWCHAAWARAPSIGRYLLLLVLTAAGLAAKPMLVSLPFVLLLLDAWPLGRLAGPTRRPALLEKLPLVALAVLSAVATVWAQRAGGSLYSLESIPLDARLANAPQALLAYVGTAFVPVHLSYFYPHAALLAAAGTSPWTPWALASLALVVLLSLGAALVARRLPPLAVGWAWFVAMLVPVIGLVQVGEQARADRYAYLPLVGLQITLVFGVDALVQRHARLRALAVALGIAALAALGSATFRRSAAWRDSHTLYARALEVSPRNYAAHIGLANELVRNGRADEARAHYEAALAIRPEHPLALYSYGLEEQQRGETERALELYRRAIASLPRLAAAHLNLGALLAQRGELDAARQEFEAVLAVQPDQPDARFNLALLALLEGRPAEALEPLAAVVEARPDHWMAREKLGDAYEALGRHSEAIAAFERALRVHASPNAQRTLAWILATAREDRLRDGAAALELAQAAVRASGRRDPVALEALAAALAETGDFARAAGVEEEALRLLAPSQAEPGRARLELYRAGRPFRHEH